MDISSSRLPTCNPNDGQPLSRVPGDLIQRVSNRLFVEERLGEVDFSGAVLAEIFF